MILPGTDALVLVLRHTLTARIHDGVDTDQAGLFAEAHDEHGQRVVTGRISMETFEP